MLHKLDFNKLEDSISWISELFFCVTTFFQVSDHAGPHYVSLRGDLCRPSWNNICIQNPRPPVSSFGYPVHGGTRQPREPNGPFDTIWFCETHLRYSEITINVLIVDYIPRTPLPTQIILLECWKKKHNSFAKDCAGNNSSRRCWTWMVGALRTEMLFLDGRKSGDIK